MGDASEILTTIFDCLHESFTSDSSVQGDSGVKCNKSSIGSWDCASDACIAHSLFGMNIFDQGICSMCRAESCKMMYTKLFYNINASALQTKKVINSKVDNSFGIAKTKETLEHPLPQARFCAQAIYIDHFLSTPPHVFTAVLDWPNMNESGKGISATLASLTTELDVSTVYKGLNQGSKHHLRSVVCYCKHNYWCIAYSCEQEKWELYTDKTVKVIDDWGAVIKLCEESCVKPQVLFFEAKENLLASTLIHSGSEVEQALNSGDPNNDHLPSDKNNLEAGTIQDGQNERHIKEDAAEYDHLETLKASENPSVNSVPREFPPGTSSESGVRKDLPDYSSFTGAKMLGKGLQNKAAESNCFLNVIIQARKSLWHLKPLRENFPRSHNHVGDPCAVCALSDIFTAFSSPSTMQTEAVDPAGLRVALSKLDIENFQQGQMNDASEVLMLILDCLHESITSDLGDTESNCTCIIHSQFGIKISEQFKCYKCPADQTNPPSTSFMHTINAKVLRTLKILCGEISFGQLLKRAELNLQSECDCGKPNYTNKLLSTPHVFTAFLVWERDPSAMDITATLGALTTELDIAYLYQGIDVGHMYQLVSMVCFSAPHYYCFIQSRDQERWTMYDDSNVMEIGGWDEVIQQCQGRGSQPNVLFFEADTNNCFLNVIIQSLWHLKPLRENFPRSHEHVGNPCAVCAVSDIFTAFSSLSTMQTEAVDPTILSRLRVALSNLSPDKKNFQQGQMNDATEVLMLILDCLHKSLTSDLSDTESNCTCIAHSQFGIKISEQFKCYKCSAERTNSLPTSFMHNISAKVLRSFKSICGDISFGQLLKLSELNHQSACPCGKPKYTNKLLSTPPHVFTAVLDWESTWESADDLSATLEAPTTELDVAYLYRGINVGSEYHLVSMVCFSARDYYCFTRRQQKQWTVYDSISVKVIGNWDDVVHKCEESHSLPRVVFFEAILQS